jgi:regulator of sigma E protease
LENQQTPDRADPVTPNGAEPVDDAQLSLRAWLVRNGPTLIFVAALLGLLYWKFGLDGMWTVAKVVIGLGLVIFVHELGHFAVAKWCDVHVQTFSIGFGPALPGCSFKWGETTYKFALFPLGGYVKMVGEGGENDDEDADPRSYKNKTVGQRMAIISAGVVMNVIFGFVCFIAAFKIGVHQTAPVIGIVEAGGPAWVKRVPTGTVIEQVGDAKNPYFEDLRIRVMLSGEGETVPFVLREPGQEPRVVSIEPRKTAYEANPVIGVLWPWELRLPRAGDVPAGTGPVRRGSAAAAARVLDLRPGDRVLATSDPADPEKMLELPKPPEGQDFDYLAFARRLPGLAGKPMKLLVVREGGSEETITVPPTGFEFEDALVGTTKPGGGSPFAVEEIGYDPRDPQRRHRDYFEFLRRMNEMAAAPVVVQVQRKGTGPLANVFVPPAYHGTLPGVRMEMGRVSATREESSAAEKGVKRGDVITHVELRSGEERVRFATHPAEGEKELDPLRLPDDLRAFADGRSGVTADVTVKRVEGIQGDKPLELKGLKWDDSWRYDEEIPIGVNGSLAIAELGIAYQVKATVEDVKPGTEAAAKGLTSGDVILAVNLLQPPKTPGEAPTWPDKPLIDLRAKDDSSPDPAPGWASVSYRTQERFYPQVRLLVRHTPNKAEGGEAASVEKEIELTLVEDETWPLHDPRDPRGLFLIVKQDRIAQADGLAGAVQMGMRYTTRTIVQIYFSLKSLLTRRVSATEHLQGPIDIAVYAYDTASHSWGNFILLLGIISVNLAVVNFLPIPILDGGHMVFLLYEKLRGRPASETVRYAANLCGLVLLVSLMIFVIYLGVVRHIL